MSASLVGSEMCIRDSPWRLVVRLLPRSLSGLDRRCVLGRLFGRRLRGFCLLYTSDAADDM
eukprot:3535314-Alexandrium_andersonii.AAC.1